MYPIPTFVINLKSRSERKRHILGQFEGKPEFKVQVIEAIQAESGALGLWQTLQHIMEDYSNETLEYVLICEDDHTFTNHYNWEKLQACIVQAQDRQADILLGGVSSVTNILPVTDQLVWLDWFSGLQFTIIFKNFFKRIRAMPLGDSDAADYKIASMTDSKYSIYPFISTQTEFGYSDATPKNNQIGRVTELFTKTEDVISRLLNVYKFYQELSPSYFLPEDWQNVKIPTYVINLPERTDRKAHIEKQFEGRTEFDVTIVEAHSHHVGAVGLWKSIRQILQLAFANNDDVIIICEDDHQFTKRYSKEFLFKNIFEAHRQGADVLLGGIGGGTRHAILVSKNRFWVNYFFCTQFVVLYKDIFQKLLNEPFDDTITAYDALSRLSNHKMVMHPFISVQKSFNYSDITPRNKSNPNWIEASFESASQRLEVIRSINMKANQIFKV